MVSGMSARTKNQPGLTAVFARSLLLWEKPLVAGFFAAFIYLIITSTVGSPFRVTDRAYFNLLADAFLHGQLHLRIIPPSTLDLSYYNGQYTLYWGLFPALLVLPLVAVFGSGVSDVLQAIFFGSLNTVVFAWLLRLTVSREMIQLSAGRRALLVIFFTLGTAHTPLPAVGKVWYLVTIEMLFFTMIAYAVALRFEGTKAFLLTGLAVSGILLTRMNAVLITPFLIWYLISRNWERGIRRLLQYCCLGLLPVVITAVFLLWYNQVRYNNPFESGMIYQLMHVDYQNLFPRYGIFSLHYLPTNIYYYLLYYPYWGLITEGRLLAYDGSLFLLSPLMFGAVYAVWQDLKNRDMWFLLASVLLGAIPVFILIGPTYQFGPRYTLDFITPLLLLVAFGIRRWPGWLAGLLVAISVFHYLTGALMYVRF